MGTDINKKIKQKLFSARRLIQKETSVIFNTNGKDKNIVALGVIDESGAKNYFGNVEKHFIKKEEFKFADFEKQNVLGYNN